MKETQSVVKQILKNVHSLEEPLSLDDEFATLKDAEKFLSSEYNCEVHAISEKDSTHQKAKVALPGKPAIVFE